MINCLYIFFQGGYSYPGFRSTCIGPGSTGSSTFGPSSSPSSDSSSSPDTVRGGPSDLRWPGSSYSAYAPNTVAPIAATGVSGGAGGHAATSSPHIHNLDSRLNPMDSSRLAAAAAAAAAASRSSYPGAVGGVGGRGSTPGATPHPSTMNSHSQQSHRPAFRIPDGNSGGNGGLGGNNGSVVGGGSVPVVSAPGMDCWHPHQHLQGMQVRIFISAATLLLGHLLFF